MQKSIFFAAAVTGTAVVFASDAIVIRHPGSGSARANYTRNLTCYISDALSDQHDAQCLTADDTTISLSGLPESASARLAAEIDSASNEVSLQGLMGWWNEWAYASLNSRSQSQWIRPTLAETQTRLPYKSWSREVIEFSAIKRKTRVIYRSPDNFATGVSVAETLESESGDLNAAIRETEIAIDRADATGNSDFYAYDKEGRLSSVSTFPSGERAVPGMCLSCHHSIIKKTFGRQDI
jgi:hypothetical protein